MEPTSWETVTVGGLAWKAFALLLLVALNGFFVAAEFAVVKVRASQLDEVIDLAEKGEKRNPRARAKAKMAKHVIANLDAYLSAAQLGITVASLALGMIGEPYVARLIAGGFDYFEIAAPKEVVHTISIAIALSVVTFLHVVLGEQAPKSLAIRKSLGTTLWVSRPLHWFHFLFRPAIWVLNGCASWLVRAVFRVEPVAEAELIHSAEELQLLVQETEKGTDITETEREISINALELNDLWAKEVMTPRNKVVALDIGLPFEENLRRAVESTHTRFPLVKDHLDNVIGLIHIKDLFSLMNQQGSANGAEVDLMAIKRKLPEIPEQMPLDELLKCFREERSHMAIVLDEYGGTAGMVTLEDVIEELVGEIHDEFDEAEAKAAKREFVKISDDEFTVDGTLGLYELEDLADLVLESDAVSTIGGYLTHALGHLPAEGEKATIGRYEVTVSKTDGRRVIRAHFRKLADGEGSGG
ncbi:MAG: hemolysin family protein [Verrucomicrobiales bacterium]